MATVIDAFVVSLGLDAAKFDQGQKQAVSSLKKMEGESTRTAKEMEARGKQAAEFFGKVRSEAIKFLAVFTAGMGLKSFAEQVTTADASVGRMSGNIGISADELSAWQGAAERAGGSAAGITSSLRNLNNQYQTFQRTGKISSEFLLAAAQSHLNLSKYMDKNTTATERYKLIADALNNAPKEQRSSFAQQFGLGDEDLALMNKGRAGIDAMLASQEKIGHANKADTDAAAARQEAYNGLIQASEDLGRKMLTDLTPAILKIIAALKDLAGWAQKNMGLVEGFIGVLTALSALKFAGLISGLLNIGSAIGSVGASSAGLLALLANPVVLAALGIGAGVAAAVALHEVAKPQEHYAAPEGFKSATKETGRTPRGIRNNNPGNLNYAGQEGATKEGGLGGQFAVFKTMEDGIAALARQLKMYAKRGINTVDAIISKYAPAGENNTKEYIKSIEKKLGVKAGDKLDMNDPRVQKALVEGITNVEVGKGKVSAEQIDRGLALEAGPTTGAAARVASNVSNDNRSASTNSTKTDVSIGSITVNTQATDAKGVMDGISSAGLSQRFADNAAGQGGGGRY